MKAQFSPAWNSSTKARKQRKYRANAPLHVKRRFLGTHLSAQLRSKYHRRAIPVRKEDKVTVMRGQFKGMSGRVNRVDIRRTKVYVQGVEFTKKDGTKIAYPLHASNLMITELNLQDKRRIKTVKGEAQ